MPLREIKRVCIVIADIDLYHFKRGDNVKVHNVSITL